MSQSGGAVVKLLVTLLVVLLVATGRPAVARRILTTFARFVDRGMLPNRFPDAGEVAEVKF